MARLPSVKKSLPIALLIVGCSLIHHALSAQDGMNKTYIVKFTSHQTWLSKQANGIIDSIATMMKANPGLNFKIGYRTICESSTKKNQITWDRVNLIITKFVTNNIEPGRLMFGYDSYPGDWNEIQLKPTEEKIDAVSAPHPNPHKS